METAILIITTILTALLAGVFFGYEISVNKALGRLADSEYIRAMQSINKVILNGRFFLVFMGPVVLLPVVTFTSFNDAEPARFKLLLTASILYIVATFILTIAGNVPKNDTLARISVRNLDDRDISAARKRYERPWNRMHTIRTYAAVVASILLITACTL